MVVTLSVTLNGTDINPFHIYGLSQNPFPSVAKYEYLPYILHLQKLGGDPISDTDYIRQHLQGWEPEFIELCCQKFEKGKYIRFEYTFEDGRAS